MIPDAGFEFGGDAAEFGIARAVGGRRGRRFEQPRLPQQPSSTAPANLG